MWSALICPGCGKEVEMADRRRYWLTNGVDIKVAVHNGCGAAAFKAVGPVPGLWFVRLDGRRVTTVPMTEGGEHTDPATLPVIVAHFLQRKGAR